MFILPACWVSLLTFFTSNRFFSPFEVDEDGASTSSSTSIGASDMVRLKIDKTMTQEVNNTLSKLTSLNKIDLKNDGKKENINVEGILSWIVSSSQDYYFVY